MRQRLGQPQPFGGQRVRALPPAIDIVQPMLFGQSRRHVLAPAQPLARATSPSRSPVRRWRDSAADRSPGAIAWRSTRIDPSRRDP